MSSTSAWPVVKLEDVAVIRTSQVAPENLSPTRTYLGLEHFRKQGGLLHTSSISTVNLKSAKYEFTEDAVLFGKLRPNLRKAAMPNFSGICSTDVLPIYPKNSIDRRFLYYYLLSDSAFSYIENQVSGINLPRITSKSLKALPVPLPPLTEQERIARILDTSATAIRENESLRNNIVPSAIDTLERQLGNSRSVIGDYVESISSGKNVAESTDSGSGSHVLKVSAVTSGIFRPQEAKPLPASYIPPAQHLVRNGDVLVSRANTTELLGAAALVEGDFKDLYLPDKIWRVTPKNAIDPYLLWGILRTRTVRKRISQRSSGSSGSMKNISQKNFLQVPVPELNQDQTQRYTTLIRGALRTRQHVDNRQVLLEQLHHSLSTRAFAGEL